MSNEIRTSILNYNVSEWPYFKYIIDYYGEIEYCRHVSGDATENEHCNNRMKEHFIGGKGNANDSAIMFAQFDHTHITPFRRRDLVRFFNRMLDRVYHHYSETISLSYTSQFALLDDAQHHSSQSLLAHALSLPLIIVIFCLSIGSWRPAFVPLINSIVSILVSFSIVYPVALYIASFNTLTPDLMAVVCVALTIDYDLFFFNIFERCVFPQPFGPKIFTHLPGQFGQLSISL